MKVFFLCLLILISFQSCSTSNDSPMEMEQEMEMEMEQEMTAMTAFTGDFMSGAHPTSGVASINEDKTVLTFTDFNTDDGPLLEVYLATDTSASTFITLGALKGTFGNYEYNLPTGVDYKVYNHVMVWCVTFSVNFGHAVLK